MEEFIASIVISVILIPFYYCLNIFLVPLGHCSIYIVSAVYDIYGVVRNIPDDCVFFSDGSSVCLVEYDDVGNEIQHSIYSGILSWPQSYKSAPLVKRLIFKQLMLRIISLIFVLLIIFIATFACFTYIAHLANVAAQIFFTAVFILFAAFAISFQLNPFEIRFPFEK